MENKKIQEVLESIGMSKNEAIIYLELTKLGYSSASGLAKATRLHRSNIYDVLEKLIKKGIVKLSFKDSKKVFIPISPEELISYFKQREYELTSIIPEIKKKYNRPKNDNLVVMSEGVQSIRSIIDSLLKINQPIYTYGITKDVVDILGGFIHDFHRRRIEKGIPMKHIYNVDATKRIRQLNKMPITEARYLPSLYNTKIDTTICGDKIALWIWEPPYTSILIQNESIAEAYRNYFKILWEEAKHIVE